MTCFKVCLVIGCASGRHYENIDIEKDYVQTSVTG